jgi:tetratricopeptide (TPR) repeat protein
MAIAVVCPHCGKNYNLKDHLQGKRVACTNPDCKKVFVVQSRVGTNGAVPSNQVEELALAALVADERPVKSEVPETAQKIRVVCQFCDFANEFDAAMAGKNAPCQNEECRKIIRIPLPKKEDPKDWRNVQRRPSAAKVEDAGFEGAWGNVETTAVSREAILEAKANVVEEREPRSWRQIVGIVAIGASLLLLLVIGITWTVKRRTQGRQEQALEIALQIAKGKGDAPSPLKKPQQGLVRLLAGQVESKKGNAASAKIFFTEARRDIDQGQANTAEELALLIELACLQCELAAPPQQPTGTNKLDWERDKLSGEIRATLNRLPQAAGLPYSDMRAYAVRQFVPILVAAGHQQAALALAVSMAPLEEQAEILGIIGLQLLELGHREEARQTAIRAMSLPKANAASLIALWLAIDPQEGSARAREIAPPPGATSTTTPVAQVGYADGLARQGRIQEARKIAYSGLPDDNFRAGVSLILASVNQSANLDSEDLDRCAKLAEGELKSRADLSWLMLLLTDASIRGGRTDAAKRFAQLIPDSQLKAWAKYRVLRAQAKLGVSLTEDAVAEVGPSDRLAHWLAWSEYARVHAQAHGVSTAMSEVKKWSSDVQRAFGMAGIALAQD